MKIKIAIREFLKKRKSRRAFFKKYRNQMRAVCVLECMDDRRKLKAQYRDRLANVKSEIRKRFKEFKEAKKVCEERVALKKSRLSRVTKKRVQIIVNALKRRGRK